ncbi:MAG: hypothetical protein ABH846_04075 [Patescibacteria group bacterium]
MDNPTGSQQQVPSPTNNKSNVLTYVFAATTGILLVLVILLAFRAVTLNRKYQQGKAQFEQAKENVLDRVENIKDNNSDDATDENVEDNLDADNSKDDDVEAYNPSDEAAPPKSFHSNAFGYSFDYPAEYTITVSGGDVGLDGFLLEYIRLADPDVIAEYEHSMEGYPMITFQVFENRNNLTPEEWVRAYPTYSNLDFMISEKTSSGIYGYTWSALWDAQSWLVPIVPSQNYILMVTAVGPSYNHAVFNDAAIIIADLNY